MPQKVLKFTGINRNVDEFQKIGACEDLINLRPKQNGGCRVVRPKRKLISDVDYRQVVEHSFGDTNNIIVVNNSGVVYWIDKTGETKQRITYISDDIELTFAGNVLVVYSESKNEQQVFKFEENIYTKYNIGLNKIIDARITYGSTYFEAPNNSADALDGTASSLTEALNKAASGFYSKFTNGLCGAAVVGCTYELEDGNEIWSTAFAVANSSYAHLYSHPSIDIKTNKVTVSGANDVKLLLSFDSNITKGVRKINVYSTRPVFPYEVIAKSTADDTEVRELSLEDLNLAGQLMYYQGSVPVDNLSASISLKFGAELAGEKIMDVTPGCIERVGNSVAYNNRFHYFRSDITHVIQPATVSRAPSSYAPDEISVSEWIAYVKFDKDWKLLDNVYKLVDGSALDIIYPMIGIEDMAFVKAERSGGNLVVQYKEMFYVKLKESSAYNYSYAFGVMPTIIEAGNFEAAMEVINQVYRSDFEYDREIFWKKETNTINVSAQYNPFVFPVEYSYIFGGEILDIATSYNPISSTQIGQYPVTVFTTNGIYAFEQGNGMVLYSNITPIQPLVIEGKAVSTPNGIFFKSSKNLYVLTGRDAANISSVLNGNIDVEIRENEAYNTLCMGGNEFFYNFQNVLSRYDFDKHIVDATLSYDPMQNEVYINSGHPNYEYAYVLNIDTMLYHKVSTRYYVTQNSGRYAIGETCSGNCSLVSLLDENDATQPVLLQSRPLSLEMFYTHIQRLIMMVDAKLTGSQYLCLSVFGSDNLNDWKCIISSQKINTVIRQIRTNKAPKSYKDYVILITGMVDSNTDLSDIIADYTIVKRRLG